MGCLKTQIRDLFLPFSATKVVASWTLFIGIFIVVLNVLFQDSNIPARRKYQHVWIEEKSSPISVRPLLLVHYPKHMEQLVKETSAENKAIQFQCMLASVDGLN